MPQRRQRRAVGRCAARCTRERMERAELLTSLWDSQWRSSLYPVLGARQLRGTEPCRQPPWHARIATLS
jgi:hypothetical protein